MFVLAFASVISLTTSFSISYSHFFVPIDNSDHKNIKFLPRIKWNSNDKFTNQNAIYIRGGGVPPLNSLPTISDLFQLQPTVRDSILTGVILSETVIWLKIWTTLAKKGILPSNLTRKIIHSGSVPLFLIHWPLYSLSPSAKYFAATIPLLQILRFTIY